MSFSEYSALRFRCARTGQRFTSVFGRYSPSHRFQFVENREGTPDPSPLAGLAQKAMGLAQQLKAKAPALLSASSALLRPVKPGQMEVDITPAPAAGPKLVPGSFGVGAMDFTGWSCPHCTHGQTRFLAPTLFVRCGKCGDYICGARVRQVNGETVFACHDGCGNTGAVQGTITSYDGATVDARSNPRLKGEGQKQLSPSQASTAMKKKKE